MRQETPNILDNVLPLNAAAPAPPTTTLLALAAITNDGGTQMRAGMNADTVKEYEDALTDADAWPFPPVVVYHDGARYWLADGFHRLNAAHRSGKFQEIPADIKPGTRRDAVLYAAGANASHGLRRTNEDKKRAVKALLEDEEWSKWSDREIARRCHVTHPFVGDMRKELTGNGFQSTSQRTGADGRTINTANIGTNRSARLYVGDLKGLVARWMGMHWPYNWPDNPSHTNGEFWRSLVAWMHENVRETWQEGDLKEAIKALHWLSRPEPQPAASAPSQQIAPATGAVGLLAVWELEKVAREVNKEVYGDKPQPAEPVVDGGRPLPDPEPDAFQNLTRAVIVEKLEPELKLLGFAQMEIDEAGLGMENRCRAHARHVLKSYVYRTSDLNAALMLIGGRRAQAAANREIIGRSLALAGAVVDGERPLPAWAAEPEPATVEQTVADVVEVYGEPEPVAVPAEALPVSQRSDYESDEWYTPQEYIDAAREVMGAIELDPASSDLAQSVVQATKHLTRAQDGLAMKIWLYQRIWLNPPYSNPAPWIEKLVREHQAGPYCSEAIVLVNNATETSWFQLLLENFPVCLPARRLAFWRHDHANVGARQGQAFFYLGPNADKFEQVFKRFGPILRRIA